jgi:predicted nucleotidyltransferase
MPKKDTVRFASYDSVSTITKNKIRDIFLQFQLKLPFIADEFELVGSYARQCAQDHSDFDVCIATGTEERRQQAIQLMKENIEMWQEALNYLRYELYTGFGLRIQISLEAPTITEIPVKTCYKILAREWFNKPEGTTVAPRFDKNIAGEWVERIYG